MIQYFGTTTDSKPVNHVTGSNLIECDQMVLKEMGIQKIGDRVRLQIAIKGLRSKVAGNRKKRTRDSLAALERPPVHTPYTPSSSVSPRQANGRGLPTPRDDRRRSRIIDGDLHLGSSARPGSPLVEGERKALRRYGERSPVDNPRKDQRTIHGTNSNPSSASTNNGRRPDTPNRQNPAADSTVGPLPAGQSTIRVIYGLGQSKVLEVKNCKTAEDIMLNVLRKLHNREDNPRNYCLYTIGEQDPPECRRIPDSELPRICFDPNGKERGRLILRKLHAGEPEEDEVRKAVNIRQEEHYEKYARAIYENPPNSRTKIKEITGEDWNTIAQPLSPLTFKPPTRRTKNDSWLPPTRSDSRKAPKPKIREFYGQRPPSELISQALTTYFPDHPKDSIERTVRMSMRRSARLSRAASRMSVASNVSFTSSLKDAPPLPNIADAWLDGTAQPRGPRPLSIHRSNLQQTNFRDSIASSSLQPLQEESPVEPNRKSYVSFESDSQPPSNVNGSDESHSALGSYYDESGSSGPTTEAGGSLNDQLNRAIAEDGEEPDEELSNFLKDDPWDNVKWMQGALIGQGSFGSVFLALHAFTGELMAVKQVEVPKNSSSAMDKKKENMIQALRREIDLLRDLQHENIVQYLGSNIDEEHFNIFLEYVPGGSVAGMLNSYGSLQEPLIRNFVRQILNGLSYLHGRDIIHRDIKGANVLVDNKGNIKISDFGISKRVEASALLQPSKNGGHVNRPSLQGSVYWMAPEVVKQTSYTRKADIWSLGCLVVEMFTGTHPFPNYTQLQAIFQIGSSSAKPNTPDNVSDEGRDWNRGLWSIIISGRLRSSC